MARHLSVATAIEKNRIASDTAFLILIEVDCLNAEGEVDETLRLVQNDENIQWQGDLYLAARFEIDISEDLDAEPTLNVVAFDASGYVRERMEGYDGGTGCPARVTIVNSGNLDQPPELREEFEIVAASTQDFEVTFQLGVDNLLTRRFPNRMQSRDQCPLLYKGGLCRYAGPKESCDYTYEGANGCKAHNNEANYGGFRGLQTLQV